MKINKVKKLPSNPTMNFVYLIDDRNTTTYTHGFYKYPAKFIPQVPQWAIANYSQKNDYVLDPFAGSGTSLVEAYRTNRKALGIEIDTFGKILTYSKTTPLSKNDQDEISNFVKTLSKKVIIPEIRNIRHWFDEENIQELGRIMAGIKKVTNVQVSNFLKVALASIIRKASHADAVSPKPYVSKKHPKKPLNNLIELFEKSLTSNLVQMNQLMDETNNKFNAQIIGNDARKIRYHKKIQLIITSPPYINAFDYVRTLRLENLWLGLETEANLLKIKREHIGTESFSVKELYDKEIIDDIGLETMKKIKLKDNKRYMVVAKYFCDMKIHLNEAFKSLKKNGVYVLVVGNSKIRGVDVDTADILTRIAESVGFVLENKFGYLIQNHYLRIPRQGKGGHIKVDWVIILRKK